MNSRLLGTALPFLLAACGSPPEPAPVVPTTPAVATDPTPPTPQTPPAPPARFVPAGVPVRVPLGEERGVVGTDVVVRVDHPQRAEGSEACSVHVVVRAGTDVRDEVISPCDTPVVFHGLTISIDGEGLWTSEGLVGFAIAADGADPAHPTNCETDADCVLSTYTCCSAPRCDPLAYNIDELTEHTDFCAHRICRPWEPRPCGDPPDPPPTPRAVCVAHVCQVAP